MNTEVVPKLCYNSIALQEMVGKSLFEVVRYLGETYGEDKLAKVPDNSLTSPDEFKYGKQYVFPGSLDFEDVGGGVICFHWNDGCGNWYVSSLSEIWSAEHRAVVLDLKD